jgi:hypothetical protein
MKKYSYIFLGQSMVLANDPASNLKLVSLICALSALAECSDDLLVSL